jgi:hypothetical protein
VIDGKRMIIIMNFLNCIQEKKRGKAGRAGVGGKAVVAVRRSPNPRPELLRQVPGDMTGIIEF